MKHDRPTRQFAIDGSTFEFSLHDDVSRRWFARYAEGALHEPRATALMLDDLRSCRAFADVGAFLGYYTCLACRVARAPHVYAFEMDAKNISRLEANVKINNCTSVEIHQLAVGSSTGAAEYMTGADPFGAAHRLIRPEPNRASASMSSLVRRAAAKSHRIRQTTIDAFFEERHPLPDVLKIDVEGAELDVLIGMEKLIEQSSRLTLYIEIHPGAMRRFFRRSPDELVEHLIARGFQCAELQEFRSQPSATTVPLRQMSLRSSIEENAVIRASK